MTTETMSEKDALYLHTTEPEKLMWRKTSIRLDGDMSGATFLEKWRNGLIVLALIPDEPPKPVRAWVNKDNGWLSFYLPSNHKQYGGNMRVSLDRSASLGGIYVYHLPSEKEWKSSNAPLWWDASSDSFSQAESKSYHIIWPSEIEFSPEFLTNHKGDQ